MLRNESDQQQQWVIYRETTLSRHIRFVDAAEATLAQLKLAIEQCSQNEGKALLAGQQQLVNQLWVFYLILETDVKKAKSIETYGPVTRPLAAQILASKTLFLLEQLLPTMQDPELARETQLLTLSWILTWEEDCLQERLMFDAHSSLLIQVIQIVAAFAIFCLLAANVLVVPGIAVLPIEAMLFSLCTFVMPFAIMPFFFQKEELVARVSWFGFFSEEAQRHAAVRNIAHAAETMVANQPGVVPVPAQPLQVNNPPVYQYSSSAQ